MADTGYNFDRIVKLRFVASTEGVDNAENASLAQIVFDTKENRDYCPRIDFWVQGKGCEYEGEGDFFKTARIDVYNINDEIRDIIRVYENVDNSGAWNVGKAKIFVTLEVGHRNQGTTVIFVGTVGSYNIERIQTESTVDTVLHMFCQSKFASAVNQIGLQKAASGTDYTEEQSAAYCDVTTTGHEAIRDAIKHDLRSVLVKRLNATGEIVDSNAIFIFEEDKNDIYFDSVTTAINEENLDEFFEIKYVMADKKLPDLELEREWKTNQNYLLQGVISNNLEKAVRDIARKWGNCAATIIQPSEDNLKTQILIYRPDMNVTAGESLGRNWVIHNFENLLKAPMVSGGTMQFTMFMEPSMRTFDTIELDTPDENFDKTPSFEFNFNQTMAGAQTVFAGTQVLGLAAMGERTKIVENLKTKGNIFNKKYNVLFIEHKGSTHTNTWETVASCTGVVVGESKVGGIL